MSPPPVPRHHGEQRGYKQQRHSYPRGPQRRRSARPRPHPSPRHAAHPQRKQERGKPNGLQQEIADERAEESHPVGHRPRRRRVRCRIPRGIRGMVGRQRAKEQNRDKRQHHPEKHVQGSAPRRREGNLYGLHRMNASPRFTPRNPVGRGLMRARERIPEQLSLSLHGGPKPAENPSGEPPALPGCRFPGGLGPPGTMAGNWNRQPWPRRPVRSMRCCWCDR